MTGIRVMPVPITTSLLDNTFLQFFTLITMKLLRKISTLYSNVRTALHNKCYITKNYLRQNVSLICPTFHSCCVPTAAPRQTFTECEDWNPAALFFLFQYMGYGN